MLFENGQPKLMPADSNRTQRGRAQREDEMSQLFDWFACSRPIIEQWAEALADGDEVRRAEIEATMPRREQLDGKRSG